jgi:uncharacterized phage protein (TIGR02220 family)
MSKRYTDTEIWDEDWFIDLEGPYQLFWFYVKDRCDHAGFWRPNFKRFEQISGHKIHKDKFLELANHEKQRIIVLDNGKWFLVNYISFHYSVLNLKNRFHNSVYETFRKNVNCENTIDYGFEVKLTSNCPQLEVNKEQRLKNKEQRLREEINPKENQIVKEVLAYLNEKLKTHYQTDTAGFISGRLEDGYTIDDFKKVIDKKTKTWLPDLKMQKYLRPKTLFSPEHFQEYLNELELPPTKQPIYTPGVKIGTVHVTYGGEQ